MGIWIMFTPRSPKLSTFLTSNPIVFTGGPHLNDSAVFLQLRRELKYDPMGQKVYFDNKIDKKKPTPINTGLSERKIREYNLFESLPLRQSL